MADTDLAAMTPLYQKVYDGDPAQVVYGGKLGDVFRSNTDLENNGAGEAIVFEVISSGSVLASPDYEIAGGALAAFRFEVKPVSIHFRATVTREAIDTAKGKGSKKLFEVTKMALDMALHEAMRKFDRHAAARRGELGVIQAIAGSTITIASPSAPTVAAPSLVNRLKQGMVMVAAVTPGAGVLKGADPGDTGTILNWNDDTGVITLTAAVAGTFAVGDTLFEKGDAYFTQTLRRRTITGALDWLNPVAAVNGENFHGQDRYDNPRDTQPIRFNCSGKTYRTALLQMASRGYGMGREFNICFAASDQWANIILEADAREIVAITISKDAAGGKKIVIGAQAIAFSNGAGGMMNILQWPLLEPGIILMGNTKNAPFKIAYTDKLVRLHSDGQDLWRRVEGGVTDATTGEKIPALRAEGDLRVALLNKAPSDWLVGYNFTGP